MEALIPGNKFAKGQYVISDMHRIYKVKNVPGSCWCDDRKPGYLLGLVGVPDDEFKIEKRDAERRLETFAQTRDDYVPPPHARFEIDDWMLQVDTGNVFQITDLPTDCVLAHNSEPAYGCRAKSGKRYFISQKLVEDTEAYTRLEPSIAALIQLGEVAMVA